MSAATDALGRAGIDAIAAIVHDAALCGEIQSAIALAAEAKAAIGDRARAARLREVAELIGVLRRALVDCERLEGEEW